MTMHGPAGEVFPNQGLYLDLVPGARLVFTDAFTSAWQPSGKAFMVAEITLAAREQAQGIEHVSVAIEQMSKVAQDTAESANQIAHAAEQTHDQGKSVEELVEQGIRVVGFGVQRGDRGASVKSAQTVSQANRVYERSSRVEVKRLASGPASEPHFKDF